MAKKLIIFSYPATLSIVTCQFFLNHSSNFRVSVRPICSVKLTGISCIRRIWHPFLNLLWHSYTCWSDTHVCSSSPFILRCFSFWLPKIRMSPLLFSYTCFQGTRHFWSDDSFQNDQRHEGWQNISIVQMTTILFRFFRVKIKLLFNLPSDLMNIRNIHIK